MFAWWNKAGQYIKDVYCTRKPGQQGMNREILKDVVDENVITVVHARE